MPDWHYNIEPKILSSLPSANGTTERQKPKKHRPMPSSPSSPSSTFHPAATATVATSTKSNVPVGTATSPLSFTTPYVYSPQCTGVWDLTSAYLTHYGAYVPVLASDPADPRVSSCQPPGWADVVPSSLWTFSPAVCPSDWTAYKLSTGVAGARLSTYSSAVCCSSGFHLGLPEVNFQFESFDPMCYRSVSGVSIPATSAHGKGSTGVFTDGLQIHQAWVIRWADQDTSTLSPQPPALTNNAYIPTWVPGASVAPGSYDMPEDETSTAWDPLKHFLEIGLPLIIVALAIGIGCCCCCHLRRNKTRRAQT